MTYTGAGCALVAPLGVSVLFRLPAVLLWHLRSWFVDVELEWVARIVRPGFFDVVDTS